jgi:hypothetical protein
MRTGGGALKQQVGVDPQGNSGGHSPAPRGDDRLVLAALAIQKTDGKQQKKRSNWRTETVDGCISLIYSPNRIRNISAKMQALAANASRVISEVRLRLLALTVAILGLVLAPLGSVG